MKHPTRDAAIVLPRFATEQDFATWALDELSQWFLIDREIVGEHCAGKRLRLDAVLRPRDSSGWHDEQPAFGVEFKLPRDGWNLRDHTGWIRQMIDYAHTNWIGFGRLAMFACPTLWHSLPNGAGDFQANRLLASLLGQLGVGELAKLRYRVDSYDGVTKVGGWSLMVHAGDVLWSEGIGPRAAKSRALARPIGHSG